MTPEAIAPIVHAIDSLKEAILINQDMDEEYLVTIYRHGSSLEMMLYAHELDTEGDVPLTVDDLTDSDE